MKKNTVTITPNMAAAVRCVGAKTDKYRLDGVAVSRKNRWAQCIATDGRMAVIVRSTQKGQNTKRIIIPSHDMKILQQFDCNVDLEITGPTSVVAYYYGDTRKMQTLPNKFPNVEAEIPKCRPNSSAVINPFLLRDILDIVIASQKGDQSYDVTLELRNGTSANGDPLPMVLCAENMRGEQVIGLIMPYGTTYPTTCSEHEHQECQNSKQTNA